MVDLQLYDSEFHADRRNAKAKKLVLTMSSVFFLFIADIRVNVMSVYLAENLVIKLFRMKDILDKNTWDRPYAVLGWGSLTFALLSSIVFFAGYGGTAWWVVYYARPDGQISTEMASNFAFMSISFIASGIIVLETGKIFLLLKSSLSDNFF